MQPEPAKKYQTRSVKETQGLAATIAAALKPGAVLALVGELGSGKTCFVQGLAAGLEVPEKIAVASPTFVLIHEYTSGRLPLYHFDFYRLEKREELLQLGLEEYWEGEGVSVVEWADRFPEIFPKRTQWIYFETKGETMREIAQGAGPC